MLLQDRFLEFNERALYKFILKAMLREIWLYFHLLKISATFKLMLSLARADPVLLRDSHLHQTLHLHLRPLHQERHPWLLGGFFRPRLYADPTMPADLPGWEPDPRLVGGGCDTHHCIGFHRGAEGARLGGLMPGEPRPFHGRAVVLD
jgi:hypothetical protein